MNELKTWVESFQAIWDGRKKYEVRKADRDFKLWNVVWLREWDEKKQKYTGREIAANIVYVTEPGSFGLSKDVCVFGVHVYQKIDRNDEESKAPKV